MWVRRTNSPIAGPEKARVPGPSTINAPNQPICSARYAPSAEPALPSRCPLATPRPCSSISTKSQRKSPPAHTPFSFSIKLDARRKDLKAGTPKPILEKLTDALDKALDDDNSRKRLLDLGTEIPDQANRGQQPLAALVRGEIARWTPIIKAANVKPE